MDFALLKNQINYLKTGTENKCNVAISSENIYLMITLMKYIGCFSICTLSPLKVSNFCLVTQHVFLT